MYEQSRSNAPIVSSFTFKFISSRFDDRGESANRRDPSPELSFSLRRYLNSDGLLDGGIFQLSSRRR
jgi:hypothetical protein